MVWLRKAVAAGWKNPAHMAKDRDLATLRDRVDFKQMLADLEAGAGSRPTETKASPKP
jgi:hypothetical protein